MPFSSVHTITQGIQQAYAGYLQQSQRWIKNYTANGGKIYCGAGCFACCDMPIRVSLAEALVTAQALNQTQATAMEAHAHAVQRNADSAPNDDVFVERHRGTIGVCPLLGSQGACSAYDVRPTRCRDTFSAFPAKYCVHGTWEKLSRSEKAAYQRQVARTPATDGELHFIAPLEYLSEPVWETASRLMQQEWGVEVWGDFWTMTSLALDPVFMKAIEKGQIKKAYQQAQKRGLAHPMTLEIQ